MSISGSSRRGLLLRAGITSVVTVAVLLLAWRLLGKSVAWEGVHLSVTSVLVAAFGAACFLIGRAWRFGALLPRRDGPPRELLGATAASWGAGLLLPGPSADVAFVAVARTRLGIGVARGSGSAIVARILDVVSLALIAVMASFFTTTAEPVAVILVAGAAFVAGLGALLSLIIPGPRTLVTRLAGRIPRLAPMAARAEAELEVLNSRARWANLVGSTIFCRVATAVQYAALMSMVGSAPRLLADLVRALDPDPAAHDSDPGDRGNRDRAGMVGRGAVLRGRPDGHCRRLRPHPAGDRSRSLAADRRARWDAPVPPPQGGSRGNRGKPSS